MKTLSYKQTQHIAGGIAEETESGVIATDGDRINIKGMIFTSDGRLLGGFSGAVYHNYATDPDPACIFGHQIAATPIQGGYFYAQTGMCNIFG